MDPIKLFALIYNLELENEEAFIKYFAKRFAQFEGSEFLRRIELSLYNPKYLNSVKLSEAGRGDCKLAMEFACAMQVARRIPQFEKIFNTDEGSSQLYNTLNEDDPCNTHFQKMKIIYHKTHDRLEAYISAETLDELLVDPEYQNLLPDQINWYLLQLGQGESCATTLSTPPVIVGKTAEERIQLQRKLLQIAPTEGLCYVQGSSFAREENGTLLQQYTDGLQKSQRDYSALKGVFRFFGGKPDKAYSPEIELEAAGLLKFMIEEPSKKCAHISFSEVHIKALQQGSLGRLVRNHMPEVYACLDLLPRKKVIAENATGYSGQEPGAIAAESAALGRGAAAIDTFRYVQPVASGIKLPEFFSQADEDPGDSSSPDAVAAEPAPSYRNP